MGKLERIGVAIEEDLLSSFDALMKQRGYTNRSEAFRDLIRNQLIEEKTATTHASVVGSVTLIYDHHASGLPDKLMELQHEFHELVVSTTHAHLDHDSCLEVIILRGPANEVDQFASRLIGLKGVVHGKLVKSVPAAEVNVPAGKMKAGKHPHAHPHSHSHKH